MSEIHLFSIPAMTLGQLTQQLADAYCTLIREGIPVKTMPSVMLWGPPGVGKSQAVRQIAERIEQGTGKTAVVTDVRLSLFTPIDSRDSPTVNTEKTLAIWLKPQILQMDPGDNVVNLLFLDENFAVPQSVQAAAYQIALDRMVGEHKLPENCIVLTAGDQTTDKSLALKMPKALANRLLHIEVVGNFSSWRAWAVHAGIHSKVIGFLSFAPAKLMAFDSSADDLAFATPRSWEMVSNLLNYINDDPDKLFPLIAGLVGLSVAAEFRTWCKIYQELPDIQDIFDGKMPQLPKSTDAMYALVSSMTSYAQSHKEDLVRIANSIRYAQQIPPDFSVVLMKDYMNLAPDYREKLLTIPEFTRWMQTKGRLLNGSVLRSDPAVHATLPDAHSVQPRLLQASFDSSDVLFGRNVQKRGNGRKKDPASSELSGPANRPGTGLWDNAPNCLYRSAALHARRAARSGTFSRRLRHRSQFLSAAGSRRRSGQHFPASERAVHSHASGRQ